MPIAQIEAASSYGSQIFIWSHKRYSGELEKAPKKIPPNSFSLSGGTINRKSFLFYND